MASLFKLRRLLHAGAAGLWVAVLVGMLASGALAQQPADQLSGPPAAPAGASAPEPGKAAQRAGEEPLPEAWLQLGRLFFDMLDARLVLRIQQEVEPRIDQRVQARVAPLEQRLTEAARDLQGQLAALQEQLQALQTELGRREAALAQLDAHARSLEQRLQSAERRTWLAIGVAVAAVAAGLLIK